MSEVPAEEITEEPALARPESLADLKPKMKLKGVVSRLELYGAFIDIGVGVNALIHISQLGQEHVNRVSDALKEGDEVTVWVDKVDAQREQIMVSMLEPLAVEWRDLKEGQVYHGTITRLEAFGAFVDIGAEREGLVHISELSHEYVRHPGEVLSVGDEVDVKILGFSRRKRRIDLSVKALLDAPEAAEVESKVESPRPGRPDRKSRFEEPDYADNDLEDEELPTAMEIAMRKAMGSDLPTRDRGGDRKSRRRSKHREQQDSILDRTLHMQEEN